MRDTGFVPKIKLWEFEGNVYIWRFLGRRKFMSGWHFVATEPALKSLLALVEIMLAEPSRARKRIPLSPPSQEIVYYAHGHDWPWEPASELYLALADEETTEPWKLQLDKGTLCLTCDTAHMRKLKESLEDQLKGEDDFCIWPSNGHPRFEPMTLWFW